MLRLREKEIILSESACVLLVTVVKREGGEKVESCWPLLPNRAARLFAFGPKLQVETKLTCWLWSHGVSTNPKLPVVVSPAVAVEDVDESI
jgi:hypothetical protein